MRVISQDGTIDEPYDICSFSISVVEYVDLEQASIYCNNNHTSVVRKMATYSTDAKALKAMEMLRKFYMTHTMVLFNKMACKVLSKEEATNIIGGVFQFPTEEELE